jgi:hypothetical protein
MSSPRHAIRALISIEPGGGSDPKHTPGRMAGRGLHSQPEPDRPEGHLHENSEGTKRSPMVSSRAPDGLDDGFV